MESIVNINSLFLNAESNDASYSVTISISERKVEQKEQQIRLSFQIEGYGHLNESVIVISSDYDFLRLDTYNVTAMISIADTATFSKINTFVTKKTLSSWAQLDIGKTLATNYPQALIGSIKIDLDNKVPIGIHEVKLSLIGRTGNNTYIFTDRVGLEIVDVWGANPIFLPLLTFVLGLISGIFLLAIGRYFR